MTKRTIIILVSVLGGLVLLVALFAGAIVGLVFYTLSRSEAAQTAKSFLQSSEKLKQDIGEVKDFGSLITGNISSQNQSGDATLNIKVIGERRTVNTTVVMMYRAGRNWRVTDATYTNEAGQTVELVDKYGPDPPEQ
ncbi:MAG TPA: cytochrome c oxidase assembly factor Coa1 family protein [Pyrinomonadaceae bacterium]|nr:cytochrome c oxidase assembly factor Coa1 family protein [Pyrinomonadaceae bacterium]